MMVFYVKYSNNKKIEAYVFIYFWQGIKSSKNNTHIHYKTGPQQTSFKKHWCGGFYRFCNLGQLHFKVKTLISYQASSINS